MALMWSIPLSVLSVLLVFIHICLLFLFLKNLNSHACQGPPNSTLFHFGFFSWPFLLLLLFHGSQRLIICLTAYGLSTLRRQTGPEDSQFPLMEVLPNACKTLGNHGNWLRKKEGWWLSLITDQFDGGNLSLSSQVFFLFFFYFPTLPSQCVGPILMIPPSKSHWVQDKF